MDNLLIHFENLDWEIPPERIRYKTFIKGKQQIRLLEFFEGYEEKKWCTKGHMGYVLEGKFTLHFKTNKYQLKAGDIIRVPEGEEFAHRPILEEGENARVLLFELLT